MKKNNVSNMDTINAMEKMSFMFMLTKMSFSEIAEAYFDAEAEWSMMWFTGLEDETSAPWKAKAIKEYLIGKCLPDCRDEIEDSLSELAALASDAGEQTHVGACLFNEESEADTKSLIIKIASFMPGLMAETIREAMRSGDYTIYRNKNGNVIVEKRYHYHDEDHWGCNLSGYHSDYSVFDKGGDKIFSASSLCESYDEEEDYEYLVNYFDEDMEVMDSSESAHRPLENNESFFAEAILDSDIPF